MNIERIPKDEAPKIVYEPATWAAVPGEIEAVHGDSPFRGDATVPPPPAKDPLEGGRFASDRAAIEAGIARDLSVSLAQREDGDLVWKRADGRELGAENDEQDRDAA